MITASEKVNKITWTLAAVLLHTMCLSFTSQWDKSCPCDARFCDSLFCCPFPTPDNLSFHSLCTIPLHTKPLPRYIQVSRTLQTGCGRLTGIDPTHDISSVCPCMLKSGSFFGTNTACSARRSGSQDPQSRNQTRTNLLQRTYNRLVGAPRTSRRLASNSCKQQTNCDCKHASVTVVWGDCHVSPWHGFCEGKKCPHACCHRVRKAFGYLVNGLCVTLLCNDDGDQSA